MLEISWGEKWASQWPAFGQSHRGWPLVGLIMIWAVDKKWRLSLFS
jgi:hypothetical protein